MVKVKTSFTLPKGTLERLREVSKSSGLSMSAIVVLALEEFFKRKGGGVA